MKSKNYDVYVRIGLSILYYRKQRKMTQEQLAETAGYSRNHIQQIETAITVPSVDALIDISKALGVPIANLFGTMAP